MIENIYNVYLLFQLFWSNPKMPYVNLQNDYKALFLNYYTMFYVKNEEKK